MKIQKKVLVQANQLYSSLGSRSFPWAPFCFQNFLETSYKQECIPVGCLPPVHRPYLVSAWSRGGGLCTWSRGGVPGPRGCTWPWGVPGLGDVPGPGGVPGPRGCTWSWWSYLVPGGCTWSGRCTWSGTPPPPVDRITDACKNITLPQLRCGR